MILHAVFVAIATLALLYAMLLYERNVNDDAPVRSDDGEYARFGMDFRFNEDAYSGGIDIENRYDCNVRSLRKCRVDDATTLFGCRELNARCRHFDRDIEYTDDATGERIVVPRNESPTEGYALAITDAAKGCNPYHGVYVLVTVDRESQDYMLICECMRPGYVGNESLLGSCTTVRVCDGRVDNIDQPLERVNCVCGKLETNVRYADGLPACKTMLVKDANERYPDGWEHLVSWHDNTYYQPTSIFAKHVRDNVRSRRLLDPCRHSLVDPINSPRTTDSSFNAYTKSCQLRDHGVPLAVGLLGPHNPNTAKLAVDAIIPTTGTWNFIRFTDNVSGRHTPCAISSVMITPGNNAIPARLAGLFVAPVDTGIGVYGQLYPRVEKATFHSGRCVGSWPSYDCYLNPYPGTRKVLGMPTGGYRDCPEEFVSKRQYWYWSEDMGSYGIQPSRYGISLDNVRVHRDHGLRFYGITYATSYDVLSGITSFDSSRDYERHLNLLT